MLMRGALTKTVSKITPCNQHQDLGNLRRTLRFFFASKQATQNVKSTSKTNWGEFGINPKLTRHELIFEEADFTSVVSPKLQLLQKQGLT
jgi:hypothetical protein